MLLVCGAAAGADFIEGLPPVSHIAVGDLNRDGQPDLALAMAAGDAKTGFAGRVILLHQKAGKFALPSDRTFELPVKPTGLVVGDFDKDGADDLAVGQRSKKRVAFYLAGENFEKEHGSYNVNDPREGGLCAGRLSTTGLCDFLVGPVWRRWLSGDRFTPGYFRGAAKISCVRSWLADLDGSGHDDVILLGEDNQLRLYYGPFTTVKTIQPSDALEAVTLRPPFSTGGPVVSIAIGDLNSDQQPDIIASRGKTKTEPPRTVIFFQNSPTGFTEGATPTATIEDAGGPVVAADFNGDKLCDFTICQPDQQRVYVFLQKKGRPVAVNIKTADDVVQLPSPPLCMTAGDLNQDGAMELIVSLKNKLLIWRAMGVTPNKMKGGIQ